MRRDKICRVGRGSRRRLWIGRGVELRNQVAFRRLNLLSSLLRVVRGIAGNLGETRSALPIQHAKCFGSRAAMHQAVTLQPKKQLLLCIAKLLLNLRIVVVGILLRAVVEKLRRETPLDARVKFLGDNVPDSSISVVDDIVFRLADDVALRNDAKSTFSQLCRYVHPSRDQTEERLGRVNRGEFIGFEGVKQIRDFNRELARTLDMVIALVFEGIGPMFTGDLFELFGSKTSWKFHRTRFVRPISERFAYRATS